MTNREFLEFQNIKFYYHPYHKEYLASKCGQILSLKWNKTKLLKLQVSNSDYFMFSLYKNGNKSYYVHRFVYETFKGEIPKGKEIDHVDRDKKNNIIINLQLLSHLENIRKARCKKVISLNIETKEEKIFESIIEASEFHKIIGSSITLNCQKIYKNCKSKKDGKRYQFFYL